jgi:predicted nucleotidyltransferase
LNPLITNQKNLQSRFPTPYPELNQVLDELISRIQRILGEDFTGTYLQGSFALGDFDQHSDVDFIVVIKEELSATRVEALQGMHDQVYQLEPEWARHLEGSYFPEGILRDLSKTGIELWYLDHGARTLVRSDHCNTLLVRWVVRNAGVTLAGPPPRGLVDPVPVELLRAEMLATIIDWGEQILAHPEQYNNRFYQAFIVLSYCRMLHDLVRGRPGSKRAGAQWAKQNLDPAWSGLIDRTWDGRPDPATKVRQPADAHEFEKTLRFVEYVIGLSQDWEQWVIGNS